MWNARGTVRHGLKVSMGSSWVESVSAIQGYAAGVVHAQGGTRPGCYTRRVVRGRGATRAGCYAAGVPHAQCATRPGCYTRGVLRGRGATRAGCYAAGVVPAPRPPDFNVEVSLLYFGVSGAYLLARKRGGNTVVGSLKGYTRVGSFKEGPTRSSGASKTTRTLQC